ncbi:hypothetical protein VTN96DRAFT_9143 [Rasamsonia emersonii]
MAPGQLSPEPQEGSQQIEIPLRPFPLRDMTAYQSGQSNWSITNLPAILYVLRPEDEHKTPRSEVPLTDFEVFGRRVRHFPFLPRQISSQVEGWRMEAWFRMDRRIRPQDFVDRMHPNCNVGVEELEYRRKSFRKDFKVALWGSGSSIAALTRELKARGIDPARNTTRGLTPGLIDPAKGEAGGRVPLPGSWQAHVHPDEGAAVSQRLAQLATIALQQSQSSSAEPSPPSSLTAAFAAPSSTPSGSSPPSSSKPSSSSKEQHASLLKSFQASRTKSTKRGPPDSLFSTPTKQPRRMMPGEPTEQSVTKPGIQEHAGNGGQTATGHGEQAAVGYGREAPMRYGGQTGMGLGGQPSMGFGGQPAGFGSQPAVGLGEQTATGYSGQATITYGAWRTAPRMMIPPAPITRTVNYFPFEYPDPTEHELTELNYIVPPRLNPTRNEDPLWKYLRENNLTYQQFFEQQREREREEAMWRMHMRTLRRWHGS